MLPRTPVPDAERERLDREADLAEQLEAHRERLARRVALGGCGQPTQHAFTVVVHRQPGDLDEGVPRTGVAGELLAQGPDGEVSRTLLLRVFDLGRQRIVVETGPGSPSTDDLSERREGPLVVGVVAQDGSQSVLVKRVTAPRGRGGTTRADLRCRRRSPHQLAKSGQKGHDATLAVAAPRHLSTATRQVRP